MGGSEREVSAFVADVVVDRDVQLRRWGATPGGLFGVSSSGEAFGRWGPLVDAYRSVLAAGSSDEFVFAVTAAAELVEVAAEVTAVAVAAGEAAGLSGQVAAALEVAAGDAASLAVFVADGDVSVRSALVPVVGAWLSASYAVTVVRDVVAGAVVDAGAGWLDAMCRPRAASVRFDAHVAELAAVAGVDDIAVVRPVVVELGQRAWWGQVACHATRGFGAPLAVFGVRAVRAVDVERALSSMVPAAGTVGSVEAVAATV